MRKSSSTTSGSNSAQVLHPQARIHDRFHLGVAAIANDVFEKRDVGQFAIDDKNFHLRKARGRTV